MTLNQWKAYLVSMFIYKITKHREHQLYSRKKVYNLKIKSLQFPPPEL